MKTVSRLFVIALVVLVLPSLGWGAQTDFSAMKQWLQESKNPPPLPPGTKITMSNWRKYQGYMPLGMIELFKGKYGWKMPSDVEIDVGPTHSGGLPQTWSAATEKYGPQTRVALLPNGHYKLESYQGGTPFPNPQEPHKGWKVLANVFFAYAPAAYVKTSSNYGTVWAVDRFGNVSPTTLEVVYRWTDYITAKGFPRKETYAPGTWYTEWSMELSPEEAKYTAALSLYYTDQQAHPYPDQYVFVPALRRSLRLSTTARCSPVFGWDWTYDDAKLNGFNGSTSVYTGHFLGVRKILNLTLFNGADSGAYPANYYAPLGFPKPSWGKWEVRKTYVDDVTRIPSEAAGYCYSHRILYADATFWSANWVDLFDSSHKLWKAIDYLNQIAPTPGGGYIWKDIAESTAMDLQNHHETIWSSYGNPNKQGAYLDLNVPKEYMNGSLYGSPGGLMQIMR